MAASVAPATEASNSSSSLSAAEKIRPKDITNTNSNNSIDSVSSKSVSVNNNNHTQTKSATSNSHELCRSCGKASDDLYDLYHPASSTIAPSGAAATSISTSNQLSPSDEATMPSPFTTSSTTCYGKSSATTATVTSNSNNSSINTSSTTTTTTACLSTTTSCSTSSSNKTATGTFDSVAATAKATAKGQSNMENILQEMQIWHLQIKCNDGLPQRICAKCIAQFYMIHKFRRKCLKVQAQLRGLFEEQYKTPQQARNEETLPAPPPSSLPPPLRQTQQQSTEIADSADIATVGMEKVEAEMKRPPSLTHISRKEETQIPTSSGPVEHEPSSDNLQQQDASAVSSTLAATSSVSLSFETRSEKNANDGKTPLCMSPTLQADDNNLKTMDVVGEATTAISKTEAKSSPLFEAQTNLTAPLKDQQIKDISDCTKKCDIETRRKRRYSRDHLLRRSKSSDKFIDSLDKCDVVMPLDDQQNATKLAEDALQESGELRHNSAERRKKGRPRKDDEMLQRSKSSPECFLLTKAALKSYSTITTRATAMAHDKVALIRQQQLLKTLKERTTDECPQTNTTAMTGGSAGGLVAKSATEKMRNDNNNNNDHDRQNEPVNNKAKQSPQRLNDLSENSKHSCSPSTKPKVRKLHKVAVREDEEEVLSAKRRTKKCHEEEREEEEDEELKEPPRQRSKRSTSHCSKRDRRHHHHRHHHHHHHHHDRNKLSENSTMKRALYHSAEPPAPKSHTKKRKGRRRRKQEAKDIRRTSSSVGPQRGSRYGEPTTLDDENENAFLLTSLKALRDNVCNTNKARVMSADLNNTSSIFKAKEILNTPQKGNPKAVSPLLLSSSPFYMAKQAPAAHNPVNALGFNADDVKWQRRRSQRLSTSSSSSSLSSSSSSLMTSTDDEDDPNDDMEDNENDEVYYKANAYCNLQGIRNSYHNHNQPVNATPNPSMYFWKTKAQMKANANDMHAQNIFKSITTEKSSLDLPKTIVRVNPSTVSEEGNSSTCSITESLRSQTLDDKENEQPKETQGRNTPLCPADADDEDEDADNDDNKCKTKRESPEEEERKQIKRKQLSNGLHTDNDEDDDDDSDSNCDSETQCSEAEINSNSKDCKQKPITPTNNNEGSTTSTPSFSDCGKSPNRSRGGMKLILQRRSSTRFACLRQEDLWEEPLANERASSETSSPVSKRKRKLSKDAEEDLDENNPTTFLPNIATDELMLDHNKETKKFKTDQNIGMSETQTETSQTKEMHHTEQKASTKNFEDENETDDVKVSETTDVDEAKLEGEKNKAFHSKLENVNPTSESHKEVDHKLVIRVPLASLTQHFTRMHLTKDTEEAKDLGKENLSELEEKTDGNDSTSVEVSSQEEVHETAEKPTNYGENLIQKDLPESKEDNKENPLSTTESKEVMGESEITSSSANEAHADLSSCEVLQAETKENSKEIEQIQVPYPNEDLGHEAQNTQEDQQASLVPPLPETNNNSSITPNHMENQCSSTLETTNTFMSHTSPHNSAASTSEISTLDPEILEFVQETESRGADEITSSNVYCGASSKITDFINDFQNNCINSPDADSSDVNVMEVLPTLTSATTNPHLSDEIRDVEDTLNGILSEMHDRDMYTPRSGENEDFLAHSSIYSPMTDAPTTPSQSLYAESPCTVNSNPMSLSPYIQSHMDYNAMTPQSNHSSSMSGHTTATMSSTSSHPSGGGGGGNASSDHFPSYTECFAEESTQSELIGFQNDIPCFENIDLPPTADAAAKELLAISQDGEEALTPSKQQISNKDLLESLDKAAEMKKDMVELPMENLQTPTQTDENAPAPMLAELTEANVQYNSDELRSNIMQVDSSFSESLPAPQQFVLTNTPHGPIFISTPAESQQQNQVQNVQYVAMDPNNSASKMGWANSATTAPAATYFVNANGEIYLSNSSFNTLLVPPQQTTNQTTPSMDTNDNYLQVYQGQQQQQMQQGNANGSQYIMMVNNLANSGGQQYIANPNVAGNSTVLLHTQMPNNNCGYLSSQPSAGDMDLTGNTSNGVTMPTFSIATNIPGQHATVSLAPVMEEPVAPPPPPAVAQEEPDRQDVQKMLQRKIQQHKPTQAAILPRAANCSQKINLICRFCHKRPKFTNNVDYSNHIITMHPAEKPYNCDYCPKHFQRRSERQDHVAQVHGSRYQCAQCGVSFCAQRALDFHLQKYHASTLTCSIPPRVATVAPTQQSVPSSASASASSVNHHHLQQNSTSSTTSSSSSSSLAATSSPTAAYHLLHNASAQQQRLVHVEDMHTRKDAEEETKNNKCSFDSQLDIMDKTTATHQQQQLTQQQQQLQYQQQQQQQHYQQATRKLCCPDCDGDGESCCSMKNTPQNNHKQLFNQRQQKTTIGHQAPVSHITMPSPEQTEPDSTTTLRHFRKNSLKSPTIVSTSSSSSGNSNSSNYSASNYNNNNNGNNKTMRYEASPLVGVDYYGTEKYASSQNMHKCHLCDEAFPTANSLRRHRNFSHNQQAAAMPFACTICKRGFRLRNALQRHMETHDAEGRPYECNICQVRFPRPSQLTLHKLTVHKFERVHTCDECGKQFTTESSLKAHEKVAHEANSMPLPFACVYLEAPKQQKPRVSKD